MKARHEFNTDHEYRDYLLAYFAGQVISAGKNGGYQMIAEIAVQQANALIGALEAFIPEKDTFDY